MRFFASSSCTEPCSTIFVVTCTSSWASVASLSSARRIAIAVVDDAGLWSALEVPVGVSSSSVVIKGVGVATPPRFAVSAEAVERLVSRKTDASLASALDGDVELATCDASVLELLRSEAEELLAPLVPMVDGVELELARSLLDEDCVPAVDESLVRELEGVLLLATSLERVDGMDWLDVLACDVSLAPLSVVEVAGDGYDAVAAADVAPAELAGVE